MKSRTINPNSQLQSSLAGACSVLLMLCASQPGFAQQSALAKPATAVAGVAAGPAAIRPALTASSREQEAAAPGKPGGEGIKVHGHWKFEVHDPDGKLVSTREFENSLVTPLGGDQILSQLLLGQAVAADWAIALCPQSGQILLFQFCPAGSTPVAVLVPSPNGAIETLLSAANDCGGGCVSGLTKQLTGNVATGVPFGILLRGSYTAPQNVSVNAVETTVGFCESNPAAASLVTISPQACDALNAANNTSGNASLGFAPFTETAVPATQNLTTGQVLTITVAISFS